MCQSQNNLSAAFIEISSGKPRQGDLCSGHAIFGGTGSSILRGLVGAGALWDWGLGPGGSTTSRTLGRNAWKDLGLEHCLKPSQLHCNSMGGGGKK